MLHTKTWPGDPAEQLGREGWCEGKLSEQGWLCGYVLSAGDGLFELRGVAGSMYRPRRASLAPWHRGRATRKRQRRGKSWVCWHPGRAHVDANRCPAVPAASGLVLGEVSPSYAGKRHPLHPGCSFQQLPRTESLQEQDALCDRSGVALLSLCASSSRCSHPHPTGNPHSRSLPCDRAARGESGEPGPRRVSPEKVEPCLWVPVPIPSPPSSHPAARSHASVPSLAPSRPLSQPRGHRALLSFPHSLKKNTHTYFYTSFVAYIFGLGLTIFIMHIFKHAQVSSADARPKLGHEIPASCQEKGDVFLLLALLFQLVSLAGASSWFGARLAQAAAVPTTAPQPGCAAVLWLFPTLLPLKTRPLCCGGAPARCGRCHWAARGPAGTRQRRFCAAAAAVSWLSELLSGAFALCAAR